jgi:TolA-binding protein
LGIEARYWLGLVQKSQKKWPEAAKTLLKTAAAAPKGHELLSAIRYHAGDALLQTGDIASAVEQFDLVLAGDKNDAREAGEAAKNSEASPVAINGPLLILPPANALLRDSPGETSTTEWIEQASRGKIQASLASKNFDAVDREAEHFAARFPRSPFYLDVARIRARSLLEQKKYEQAASVLEPLFSYKLPPDEETEIRYLLAAAEEGMRKFDRALATLEPVFQSPSDRLKADALLLRGSILLAMRRHADAIAPLEKYLKGSPEGDGIVQAAGQLAICYARDNKIAKAKKLYADLASKYPRHSLLAPAIEQLAQAAYDADDAVWSGELSTALVELSMRNPGEKPSEYEIKGRAGIGWSQYKLGKLTEAAATFEQALQMQPTDDLAAELNFARGQTLEKLEQFDTAILLYDRTIENYPKAIQRPDAIYAAARLRMKLQQTREAAALYSRLAADYPQYAKLDAALYDWAWTLRESNQPAEADKLYQRLRKEFPKSRYWADAVYRLAQRAFEAEKSAEANALLDELLAAKPEPAVREYALYLRAQVALQSKDWSKVRPAFARLIEEFPQSRQRLLADFWIAECDYRDKKIDEAEKQFDEIAKQTLGLKEPWMAMIALRRAQIALYRKNWDDAYRFASEIEKNFPDFEQQYEADLVVGRCLANRAEFENARDAYRKVIRSPGGEKTETAAIAQWLIGETYFHQKNFETAAREFLKVDILYAYPAWQSLALLEAAKCQEQLNDFQQAESCYQRIADRYASTPSAKPAKQRLAELKKERESKME